MAAAVAAILEKGADAPEPIRRQEFIVDLFCHGAGQGKTR
jgi:hypothetical protein